MKPVEPGERLVVNIYEAEYEPFVTDNGENDGYTLQLDRRSRWAPGFTCTRWSRVTPPLRTSIPATRNSC